MFDEQQNQIGKPPSNLPIEPVDMFEEVDKSTGAGESKIQTPPDALSAGYLKKKDLSDVAQGVVGQNDAVYEMKEPIIGKVLIALLVILVVAAVGFGVWFMLVGNKKQTTSNDQPVQEYKEVTPTTEAQPQEEIPVVEEVNRTTPVVSGTAQSQAPINMNNDQILFGESIDADKDGLDDIREKELGTDPSKSDTDNDGLTDGDEVIIWKTSPLNIDTDGDTYEDGKEVRNGYNPLGPGKLFSVPQTTTTVNQ